MNPKWLINLFCLLVFSFSCKKQSSNQETSNSVWLVPDSIKTVQRPQVSEHLSEEGKANFQIYCSTCHGATGRGDGPAGQAMGGQPADLLSEKVQAQTDGELFYKISTGKEIMPSFKELLSEDQRWEMVDFIRNIDQLSKENMSVTPPESLVPDITVAHLTKVVPRAVRIWYGQNNYLWYATINGDVYRLPVENPLQLEKMLDVSDHGIARVQGATMHGDLLFLSGNIRLNDNKGTKGIVVRMRWDSTGEPLSEIVFTTEEYGTTNTPFDHGWSALQVSKDEQSIFAGSGSRTDHGEVQDNQGAYPNSRDVALTAKIFQIPINAENLVLPNNIDLLKANGYVYAEGLRNTYDLALDPEGRLLAVVNSGDYDQNEDMFWIRKGHHYGYPWVMGGMETPQQFSDWIPDPAKDPFLNPGAAARPDDFYNDPEFPEKPKGINFSKSFTNYGPDADKFRDKNTGEVLDASSMGIGMTTFTPHSSPLGLVLDNDRTLPGRFKGKAFTARYTNGQKSALMQPFTNNGEDLLLLDLEYLPEKENFQLHTHRVVKGFSQPVDAVLVNSSLYVIEYGGRQRGGNIWKISFTSD